MVEVPRLVEPADESIHRKALRRARRELSFHRNTLIFAHAALLEAKTLKERRAWYTVYSTLVGTIDQIAAQEIFPAKRALGLPIEDSSAEERVARRARRYAREVRLSPFFAEISVRGSIERSKIAQGIYDDRPASWKRPQLEEPAA